MQISNEISPVIKMALETEHQKALREIMHGKEFSTNIPMHTANMRILSGTVSKHDDTIMKTIIPELSLFIDTNYIKGDELSRSAIEYRIGYNNAPFPMGHVFGSSGSLCLGNIFVPNMIPKYSPMQPLETLFLHNDRNKNHGNPQLNVDEQQQKAIKNILNNAYHNDFPMPFMINIKNDWILNDTLWRIGNYLLNTLDKEMAFSVMHDIFIVVFPSK